MATAALARPQGAPTHYAGFWIRFVAVVIDAIIIGIVNSIVGAVFGLRGAMPSTSGDLAAAVPAIVAAATKMLLVGEVIRFVYCAYLESSEYQATIGKMVLGLKVVDANTMGRISFAQAAGRHISKFLSGLPTLCIGFIMAGFTDRKRALHDMIAQTLVVYK